MVIFFISPDFFAPKLDKYLKSRKEKTFMDI
jgi:hypothetical protein